MKQIIFLFILLLFMLSCKKEKADLIIINSKTYTVNNSFDTVEAFAIKDGKFISTGTNEEILKKYDALKTIDAKNKTIVPGLIDAHCHFYRMGLQQQKVSLEGTKSYDEVLNKIVLFQKEKKTSFITGRGWDQNDWKIKVFPTKKNWIYYFQIFLLLLVELMATHYLLIRLQLTCLESQKTPKLLVGKL